ncbi:MAG: hypothetical protein RR361_08410, partial [Anaerovorax sp.]
MNFEDFTALLFYFPRVVRQERIFGIGPVECVRILADQLYFVQRHGDVICPVAVGGGALAEGLAVGALELYPLEVKLSVYDVVSSLKLLTFNDQATVLGDDIVAGKYQIGGGFGHSAGSVHIAAHAFCASYQHKITPIIGLADHLIAGGGVEDDVCAVQSQMCSGRDRNPEILADFHAQGKP